MILTGYAHGEEGMYCNLIKGKEYELTGQYFVDDNGGTRLVHTFTWRAVELKEPISGLKEPRVNYADHISESWAELPDDDREEPKSAVQKLKEHATSLPSELLPSRQGVIDASICFGTQEDGSHYTDMQLQPLQACYLRYGLEGLRASIHTKVDKYISRKKNDDVVQLKKAHHCLGILLEIAEIEKDLT